MNPPYHPPNQITATEYRSLFPEIDVTIDWDRFARENWPVRWMKVTDREAVARFHTAFRTRFGRLNPRFLHTLFARQMRVGEVECLLPQFPRADRESILHFVDRFAKAGEPALLTLPTYRMTGIGHYVMDANHRLCGLYLAGVPFTVRLCTVEGPRSRNALNDSLHCRP